MESKKRIKGQLNKGFSLFTVIIAVSFVMILGLLVIYISVSNFYMKVTDLKGKDSFYTAEQGLEEIKVGLQQDVGTAMSKAFTEVMENYDRDSGSGNAQDTDRQEKTYNVG
jgi:Tfp pilus assembly protein PilE